MQNNIIINTDSYKSSHYLQYPESTKYVFSYIESRGGKYNETVFYGLQMFMKEYLEGSVVTQEMIDQADKFFKMHGEPFNREGWEYILKVHYGKLPITIRAVPEGMSIPVGNVLATVVNTDPKVPWLTSYIETALLRAIWYPTTVATQSREIKKVIKQYLDETGDTTGLDFKLHDFGARGVSSFESAGIGGSAHLTSFFGTDTVIGALFAEEYYGTESGIVGFSIPAAEHSTMTLRGPEREKETYEMMIDTFGGEGKMFAVVSDSYDIYNAVDNIWGKELKDKVLNMGGTVVIRPDSGDPVSVVVKVVKGLDNTFGSEVNEKGYRVLNPAVRVIQGDGINQESITNILSALKMNGYSADNIAFGMGGALLQQVNRDTQKFAMKASAAYVDGEWVDVYKDPITDKGKASKKGLLTLVEKDGGYKTVRYFFNDENFSDIMNTVFYNGMIMKEYTFNEVRKNAEVK